MVEGGGKRVDQTPIDPGGTGTVGCPTCGAVVPGTSWYCPKCRHRISEVDPAPHLRPAKGQGVVERYRAWGNPELAPSPGVLMAGEPARKRSWYKRKLLLIPFGLFVALTVLGAVQAIVNPPKRRPLSATESTAAKARTEAPAKPGTTAPNAAATKAPPTVRTTTTTRTIAEDNYLHSLGRAMPAVAKRFSDNALLGLGHVTCDAFAAGASLGQVDAAALSGGNNFTPDEMGQLVSIAVLTLCPQYTNLILP